MARRMTKSIWVVGGALVLAFGCKKDPTTSEAIVGEMKADLTKSLTDMSKDVNAAANTVKAEVGAKPGAPAKS